MFGVRTHFDYKTTSIDASYYYRYNAQGDVIALLDSTGAVVAEYDYTAYGRQIKRTGMISSTVGNRNPFRYRGYYYDTETDYYYLQSRYYDAYVGRFINSDDVDFLGATGTLQSLNLFAYCENNPINRFEINGNLSMPNWAKIAIGATIIAGLVVATIATGGAVGAVCGAALSGAVSGGISGTIVGAISGGISNGLKGAIDGASSGFLSGTVVGGITGAISAGVGLHTGTSVVGKPHGAKLHKLSTNSQAGKMLASQKYTKIGMNRSLKTMGLNGSQRPDVVGIAKKGADKIVEVISPKQSRIYIVRKMVRMTVANPDSTGRIVKWVSYL